MDFYYLLKSLLDSLKKDERSPSFISIVVQLVAIENEYLSNKTLNVRTPLNIHNETEIKNFSAYLNDKKNTFIELYSMPSIISVLFNYTIIDENDYSLGIKVTRYKKELASKDNLNEIITEIEAPANLPLNTVYESWGKTDYNSGAGEFLQIESVKNFENSIIKITPNERDKYRETNTLEILTKNSKDICATLNDIIINNNKSEFIRKYNNKAYHILNNKVHFLFEKISPKKYISSLTPSKTSPSLPMTMDIETYLDENNKMKVYCISFFDGNITRSYYLPDFDDFNHLISNLFKDLLSPKYSGRTVYIHNSSHFDLVFLLGPLSTFAKISSKSIIKDNQFINLKVLFGAGHKFNLSFRDSMLLLPIALKDLALAFGVNTLKDIFPHKFVNKNTLNYMGTVPTLEYFDIKNVTNEDYIKYCERFNTNWSLKNEAIKYCEKDCISLFEVLVNFGNKINEMFKVNIDKCPTISSLAFRIFRTSFLPKSVRIPILTNKVYQDIHNAHYGGHVDMYIPANQPGELLYQYDVNSLYPSEMKAQKYPNTIIAYFKGDITNLSEYAKLYSENLGFFKVRVKAPKNILHPLLPIRLESTTVYPVGEWTGWYYSEELKNAKNFGYQFQILEGYLFKATDTFSNYIETVFRMKEESASGTPNYVISKLLLNSLYGRFGMQPDKPLHLLELESKQDETVNRIGLHNIISTLKIGDKILYYYFPKIMRNFNINIALAGAITANSRIRMSEFKNNPEFKLFYSDTDCIFINKKLNSNLVDSKKLGLLKLENVISDFTALGPKAYGFITVGGKEIIKTKGFNKDISYLELNSLLDQNNIKKLKLNQDKWFTNFEEGTIEIKNTPYSLKPTDKKRELIYENDLLVGTSNKVITSSNNPK